MNDFVNKECNSISMVTTPFCFSDALTGNIRHALTDFIKEPYEQKMTLTCMRTIRIIPFLILLLFSAESFGHERTLYIPVTINSPLFTKNTKKEIQVGAKINNFGLNFNIDGQWKRKILIVSIQQNNGDVEFDPLNFNHYYYQGQDKHLIESYPTKMFYAEIGFGYDIKLRSQKLSLIAGIGQQFKHNNTRCFLQLDWGNENKLINAGISVRGNYTMINKTNLITLEPVVQGKLKIKKFRIVNQFGYSIAIKKHHDYMKPILTVGLDYII